MANLKDSKVQVTKVEISKPFIKVTAKKIGGNISSKLGRLQALYEVAKTRKFNTGDKCIVRLTARSYERGLVLKNNGQKASVYLIDCGCNGVFNTSDMRHLVDEELSTMPARCHEFIIAKFKTSNNAKLSSAWYRLRDILMKQPMEIEKIDDDGEFFYIDLRLGDTSLIEDIIKNDRILQKEFEEIELEDQKELMSKKQKKEPKNSIFTVTNNPEFYQREIPENAEVVMITAFEDGVNSFFLRKRSDSERCKMFVQKVNNIEQPSPYRLPNSASELNKLCLIRFLDRYYRARIVQVEGGSLQKDTIKVHLLETGENVTIGTNKVFKIPDHLAAEPPFGKQYKLESFSSLYNLSHAQISFYFKTITFKKTLHLLEEDPDETQAIPVCRLFLEGESVADKISTWDPFIFEYKLQTPLQYDVKHVVEVLTGTPSEFYVRIVEDFSEINNKIKELDKFGLPKLKRFSENNACLVKYNSNIYRGKILAKVTTEVWRVELVDLGYNDEFSTEEIFTTCEELVQYPPPLYKCILKGYEDEIVLPDADKKFEEEVSQPYVTFDLVVSGVDKDKFIVDLFFSNGANLYELIGPAESDEEEHSDWSQTSNRDTMLAQKQMVNMSDSVHIVSEKLAKPVEPENLNDITNWDSTLINNEDEQESLKSSGKSSKSSEKSSKSSEKSSKSSGKSSNSSCTSFATTEWINEYNSEFPQPSPSKHGSANGDTRSQATSVSSSFVSTIRSRSLEPEQVKITAVSSVDDFTIQKVSQAEDYKKFRSEVDEIAQQQPALESFEEGALCLAFYDLSDQWCRAVIVEAKVENEFLLTLRNVDNGESFGVTDKDDLKQMPLQLQSTAFFGRRCSLTIAANKNRSNESFQRLIRLVNQEVQCKSLVKYNDIYYVEIIANEKNLVDSFINNGLGRKMHVMPPGKVNVVHIESLDDFAVRHQSSNENFKKIRAALTDVKEAKDVKDPKNGMLVLAKSPLDKSMQRAKIASMKDGKFKVYFIDFGCFGVVDKVNELDANLAAISDTAVVCTLALPSNLKASNNEVQKFKKIIEKEKKKTISVEMVKPGEDKVEINLFIDGINVIERIFPKKPQKIDEEIVKAFFDEF